MCTEAFILIVLSRRAYKLIWAFVVRIFFIIMHSLFELPHDKTNKMTAPTKDSDQPG